MSKKLLSSFSLIAFLAASAQSSPIEVKVSVVNKAAAADGSQYIKRFELEEETLRNLELLHLSLREKLSIRADTDIQISASTAEGQQSIIDDAGLDFIFQQEKQPLKFEVEISPQVASGSNIKNIEWKIARLMQKRAQEQEKIDRDVKKGLPAPQMRLDRVSKINKKIGICITQQ